MKTRILVGVPLLLIPIFCVLFSALPVFENILWRDIPLLIFLTFYSAAGTYEFAHVAAKSGSRPLSLPAYIFVLTYCFVLYYFGLKAFVIEFFVCLIASVVGLVLRRSTEHSSMIVSMYFYVYPIMFLTSVCLTFTVFARPYGILGLSLILFVPILTDTMAYFGGYLFGKHLLIPQISPKKTVEGAVSGVIGGTLITVLLYFVQKLWGADLEWYILLPIGIITSILSQFGDLFASMFKRWADVKDFSSIFPGHGGAMDRADSVMFSGPIIFCCFMILSFLNII